MTPLRFTTIAHGDHLFLSPLFADKIDRLIGLLDLGVSAQVLEIGCGKGELLARIVERHAARGVGIDPNPAFIAAARARSTNLVAGAIAWHEAKAADVALAPHSFDLAICVGARHACGGYRETLAALAGWTRGGGIVLAGEGYWRREPAPEYLAVLGATRDEMTDHRGNIEAGTALGFTPLYSCASSEDEWDHYEGLYARGIERHLAAHPDDPDAAAMRERIRIWRDAYLRWGRDTLGFGMYVFRTQER